MKYRIHHKAVTASTNLDAHAGLPGDVYTAAEQTAGRGRLTHKWLSPPGANLMMSVVFDVEGLEVDRVSTFPLMVGLAVRDALLKFLPAGDRKREKAVQLKWPNDVLVDGKKIAGILCERQGDRVIAGVGVNVNQTVFDPSIADRATSLLTLRGTGGLTSVDVVRDAVLEALGTRYAEWRARGFAAMHADYVQVDALAGRTISVKQTDDDADPITGRCDGVMPDGTLLVAGVPIFAGEAHVTM